MFFTVLQLHLNSALDTKVLFTNTSLNHKPACLSEAIHTPFMEPLSSPLHQKDKEHQQIHIFCLKQRGDSCTLDFFLI